MTPDKLALIERVVPAGGVAVAVGASCACGREDWVTPLLHRVGARGMVYAFDVLEMPEYRNPGNLMKVEGTAVWDASGWLAVPEVSPERIQYPPALDGEQVRCVSLDDFFWGRKIDFLKVDVEGAEWRVFFGAQKLLSRSDVFVVWEDHHDEIAKFGGSADMIRQLLIRCGFTPAAPLLDGTLCWQKRRTPS
jgi:FkbM family methyltransferase